MAAMEGDVETHYRQFRVVHTRRRTTTENEYYGALLTADGKLTQHQYINRDGTVQNNAANGWFDTEIEVHKAIDAYWKSEKQSDPREWSL